MKLRWASSLPLLLSTLLALASQASGQDPTYAGSPPGAPMGLGGPMGAGGPMPYGPPPGAMPGMMYPPPSPAYSPGQQFMAPPDGGAMGPDATAGYADGGCPDGNCGLLGGTALGRRHQWLHQGLIGDLFGWVGPYPDGGCAAPRWYDVSVEYMSLKRENAGRNIDLTSSGLAGPIVLNTNQLDFDRSNGFRFSAMLQMGPGSNFEFTYYGMHFFDDEAFVADPTNDLFSVVSNFGTNPLFGFTETDESDFQSISYSSKFDNFETNFRQRWSAPNGRYQGSWLAGVRYFKLDEKFNYTTFSDQSLGLPAPRTFAGFDTVAYNSLTGGQIGGDVWICIMPGLKLGAEGKAGVFGNHVAVRNMINTTTQITGPFVENITSNDVSFVTDANVQAIYRLSQQWTLKVGYTFLYVDGVALATENFNAVPPAVFNPPPGVNRVAAVNDDGHLFYHGFTVGAEFLW